MNLVEDRNFSDSDPSTVNTAAQRCDLPAFLPVDSLEQLHRYAFCQFPFLWIYYNGSNKSTGKETDKSHFCALHSSEWTV